MGVDITDLVKSREFLLEELSNRVIVVDGPLFLYQFLTTIRQRDGSVLKDSKGNVTSHLTGLFTRTTNLMQKGIKLVYVFDGEVPELKRKELERRSKVKTEAAELYEKSVSEGDVEGMRKYASRSTRLTKEMINEARLLLQAMGIPVVEAPYEAEAQAAHMVRKGDCFAVATQDNDVLMFGADRIVKNLSIAGRRKKGSSSVRVKPELIELSEVLNELSLDRDQLIVLGMLVGTDYNIGGVRGIGPKTALKLLKKYGKDFDELFQEAKWSFETSWEEVFYQIKKMPVSDDYALEWGEVNGTEVKKILVDGHNFSVDRVESTLESLKEQMKESQQRSLLDF
ncbi:MAG: flap endonuclease-1 [Candidatus Woesearchaeota archaeon]